MPIAPLTLSQRTAIMNLIRRASKAEIMPRFRNLGQDQIIQKTSPQDLVTEADHAAEAMIARGLLNMFPNALIVGEEQASHAPEVIDEIPDAELAFAIDPIDGTWNFAHGLATFGVIVSALRFGQPVFGVLYDPVLNDFVLAHEGGATELMMPRRARQVLSASKGGALDKLLGFVPLNMLPEDKQGAMAATFPHFTRVWTLRAVCHEYRMFAQGHVDFVLSTRLNPWDHAAGVLIARQAGGHVAMLDGSDYQAHARDGYLLVASDAATWGRVRDTFDFLLEA